ncbi:hypothetical protein L1987_23526 [Smallanthus sonchifolius]|uniref:Uncharacterized protein n=1 Tax=Smallanthus sonchifolius TaxID=185202 RepID=A0ACB9IJC5_9ASTR|nr:hypothetical protein L1987_23526 [Smallanthus sonchifolius]
MVAKFLMFVYMFYQVYLHYKQNDGLLAFLENFVKDHFLQTMFVDYKKGVQEAISSQAAFPQLTNPVAAYTL